MITIKNFTDKYHELYAEYTKKYNAENDIIEKNNAKIKIANKNIKRAEIKRKNINQPYWTKEIVENIAKEMLQYFPNKYKYKILGPFGIGSKTSIWINHPKWNVHDNKKCKFPHYDFTVSPFLLKESNTTLFMIDESKDTKTYKKETIGELNGFNNPEIPIDNNITILNLIKLFYPNFKPYK